VWWINLLDILESSTFWDLQHAYYHKINVILRIFVNISRIA